MRLYTLTIHILVCFFLFQITFSQTEQPLIEVTSAVDTSRITIGDRINYTITIDHVDSMRVERPGEGVNLGQFEIKDYKVHDPVAVEGRISQKFEYVISVFDTGAYIIPAFPVAYFPTDSLSDYKLIEASPITIYVESVIQDEERQLRDVKAPIDIPYDYLWLFSVLTSILLFGVLTYLGYRLYKKRKEEGSLIKAAEPLRPVHDVAMEALEFLLARNLIENGEVKLFYSEISEIIRRYIEGRFYVPALEETSAEILQELKGRELTVEASKTVKLLLELSDLAKFAKYYPTEKENEQVVVWARNFIDMTKFVYETVSPAQENEATESEVEQSKNIAVK